MMAQEGQQRQQNPNTSPDLAKMPRTAPGMTMPQSLPVYVYSKFPVLGGSTNVLSYLVRSNHSLALTLHAPDPPFMRNSQRTAH